MNRRELFRNIGVITIAGTGTVMTALELIPRDPRIMGKILNPDTRRWRADLPASQTVEIVDYEQHLLARPFTREVDGRDTSDMLARSYPSLDAAKIDFRIPGYYYFDGKLVIREAEASDGTSKIARNTVVEEWLIGTVDHRNPSPGIAISTKTVYFPIRVQGHPEPYVQTVLAMNDPRTPSYNPKTFKPTRILWER